MGALNPVGGGIRETAILCAVGSAVELLDGGSQLGAPLGMLLGAKLGDIVGAILGVLDGILVGANVVG